MLKNILSSEIDSKIILIEDTADHLGDLIFNAAVLQILRHLQKYPRVIFVCVEKPADHYKLTLPLGENVTFLDVSKNYSLSSPYIEEILKNIPPSSMLIIDSISPFLWDSPISKFTQELLNMNSTKIIMRLHKDTLLNEHDGKLLEYISTTHIQTLDRNSTGLLVNITQKKPGGKVLSKRVTEVVQVDDDGNLSSEVFHEKTDAPGAPARVVPMNSLTTFDLGVSLSEKEKDARDRLILPYLRTSEDTGAAIEYEADEADLEEDPDEDLEL